MNWKQIIELSFKNHERFLLGEGISDSALDVLRAETNFDWPPEFVELYRCHDGVGIMDKAQNRVDWLLVPSSQITSYCAAMRDWFAKTHSAIAANFFPFYNLDYSDAMGYLRIDGKPDSLYHFNHEEYTHSVDQSWEEFLTPVNLKLQEWFIYVAEIESRFPPTPESEISDEILIPVSGIPNLPGQENIDEIIKRWG